MTPEACRRQQQTCEELGLSVRAHYWRNKANQTEASLTLLRAQQLECARYIIDGGPDQRGARLGLFDAFAEEFLMEEEGKNADKS